jgi:hypothetical protein
MKKIQDSLLQNEEKGVFEMLTFVHLQDKLQHLLKSEMFLKKETFT